MPHLRIATTGGRGRPSCETRRCWFVHAAHRSARHVTWTACQRTRRKRRQCLEPMHHSFNRVRCEIRRQRFVWALRQGCWLWASSGTRQKPLRTRLNGNHRSREGVALPAESRCLGHCWRRSRSRRTAPDGQQSHTNETGPWHVSRPSPCHTPPFHHGFRVARFIFGITDCHGVSNGNRGCRISEGTSSTRRRNQEKTPAG